VIFEKLQSIAYANGAEEGGSDEEEELEDDLDEAH
jgi:hypothetical protein